MLCRLADVKEIFHQYEEFPWQNSNRDLKIRMYSFRNGFIKKIVYLYYFNLLKPTCYVMHQQFNIQQLYALPTLYLCVLYLSENKQRLVPFTA